MVNGEEVVEDDETAYDEESPDELLDDLLSGYHYNNNEEAFPMRCDLCDAPIPDVHSLQLRRDEDNFTWILCPGCARKWGIMRNQEPGKIVGLLE